MEKMLDEIISIVNRLGLKLIYSVILLIVGIKITKWFTKRLSESKIMNSFDEGVRKFAANALKISLYIIFFISIAGILGIPYASFVAVLGSAGIAIGLALQGSLSNIASGLLLLVTKPFKVGDLIETNNAFGFVIEIGLFATKIETLDNKVISYPNSLISTECITNHFANELRRLDMVFTASYGSDIDTVKKVMIDTASSNPLTINDPVPFAKMTKQADSALEFTLRVWCKSSDYLNLMIDINEDMKKAFDKNGIEIPFPQLDVNLKK